MFFVQGEDVKKYLFGLWSNSNKLYTCLISHWMKRYSSTMYMYLKFILNIQVQKLSKNEVLMVNIGSLSTGGRVIAVKADLAKVGLTNPVCTEIGEKIALSRRVEKHWRYVPKNHEVKNH